MCEGSEEVISFMRFKSTLKERLAYIEAQRDEDRNFFDEMWQLVEDDYNQEAGFAVQIDEKWHGECGCDKSECQGGREYHSGVTEEVPGLCDNK